jgi:small-conductance mechanosensitive channel
MRILILALCLSALSCKGGTFSAGPAVDDTKFALSTISSEVALHLRLKQKEAAAAEVERSAKEVSELLDTLVNEELTSVDKLRTALKAVEARVTEALADADPEKADLWRHYIDQAHTTIAYLLQRYERAQAATL